MPVGGDSARNSSDLLVVLTSEFFLCWDIPQELHSLPQLSDSNSSLKSECLDHPFFSRVLKSVPAVHASLNWE